MSPDDPIINRKAPQRPSRAGCIASLAIAISLAILIGSLLGWLLGWYTGLLAGAVVLAIASVLDGLRRRRRRSR